MIVQLFVGLCMDKLYVDRLRNSRVRDDWPSWQAELKHWDPASLEICATLSRGKRNAGII